MTEQTCGQQTKMDRMYVLQRHIYDLTRKYYLFGRDRLLTSMIIPEHGRVLEMGCGTARNLIKLAKLRPDLQLYGIDASCRMLETAKKKVVSAGIEQSIALNPCLAEDTCHLETFSLTDPFDAVFFSYSLSMIPTWDQALAAGLRNVKPGGSVYIVDFWDQNGLPEWFGRLLRSWLALFHVHFRPELLDAVHRLDQAGYEVDVRSVGRGYAYIARIKKL
ncbi:class I SAM-dependent methyltransferase [Desulfovibrio inopinatus]|uniref:class I SAM-dependent methyltransferase n=1 Tax=Desulfovibrio inopinatus TaxID=102109 RepID=UPI000484D23C|nr:class I SAM-dependent methyltransferase [Desulfovibrio inopinatus]